MHCLNSILFIQSLLVLVNSIPLIKDYNEEKKQMGRKGKKKKMKIVIRLTFY